MPDAYKQYVCSCQNQVERRPMLANFIVLQQFGMHGAGGLVGNSGRVGAREWQLGREREMSVYESGWNVSSTSVLFQLKITCLFARFFLRSARFQFRSRHIFYIARAN